MIETIREYTKVYTKPLEIGGQHVGTGDSTVIVENKALGLKIEMGAYFSQHENKLKGELLMEMIIEDIFK